MIAAELIHVDVEALDFADKVAVAIDRMEGNNLLHLPVLRDGRYVGLISESTALNSDPDVEISSLSIQIMPVSVDSGQHILAAIRKMGEGRLSMLPVTGEEEEYLGFILPREVLFQMSEIFGIHAPGSILVLEVDVHDYSMSEIAQIVESNDALLLATYLNLDSERQVFEISLRINFSELSAIIRTFKRYNYTIVDAWHEDRYEQDLHNRFGEFMNYLNM